MSLFDQPRIHDDNPEWVRLGPGLYRRKKDIPGYVEPPLAEQMRINDARNAEQRRQMQASTSPGNGQATPTSEADIYKALNEGVDDAAVYKMATDYGWQPHQATAVLMRRQVKAGSEYPYVGAPGVATLEQVLDGIKQCSREKFERLLAATGITSPSDMARLVSEAQKAGVIS
jgi:hypothetical protein